MNSKDHLTLKQHTRERSFWIHLIALLSLWIIVLNYSSVLPPIMINVLKISSVMASLQFAGFILFHITDGKSGLLLQGFFGGFVSSTMVFIEFTQNPVYKEQPVYLLAKGLILATIAMLIQAIFIVYALMPNNSPQLFILPIFLNLLGLIICFFLIKSRPPKVSLRDSNPALNLEKPILWNKVIIFSLILAGLILVMRFLGGQLALPYIPSSFIVSFFEAHGVLAASLSELVAHNKIEQVQGVILAVLLGHISSKILLVVKSTHKGLTRPVSLSLICSAFLAFLSLLL